MNVFKATVATAAQAAIARQFSGANHALKEAYAGLVKSADAALTQMEGGLQPFTIGGNQVERMLSAQAKYEELASMLPLTGLNRSQIAELVQADAVFIEAADAE